MLKGLTLRRENKKARTSNEPNAPLKKRKSAVGSNAVNSTTRLQDRLLCPGEVGKWLLGGESNYDVNGVQTSRASPFEIFGNRRVADFFNYHFDGHHILARFEAYNKCVETDKDRIRLHGQYYNNIYLGKRIFGPARKQAFQHTIVGGMERRFEIIDNQVNHIAFTHEHSDKFVEKCRNTRIKCRDDTRVTLAYPPALSDHNDDTFIHANRVATPLLFNDFIVTQAPMENTIGDFWRMVWQEQARYIFMLIRKECKPMKFHELQVSNEGFESTSRDPFFRVTRIRVLGPEGKELRVEHWQADLNNSENFESPLRILRLARSCSAPTIVHDCLGISRAACLIASEMCIAQLLRGPDCDRPVQRAVHLLRSFRPFSVETPMQYIFVHRVVQHFIRPFVGAPDGFEQDYARWLDVRSQRLFVDALNRGAVPSFRLLSPKVDPDLLPLVRHRERPENRREIHAHVGEFPLPIERDGIEGAFAGGVGSDMPADVVAIYQSKQLNNIQLPKRYPRGRRY